MNAPERQFARDEASPLQFASELLSSVINDLK
jgi:hypothetical protein